MQRRNFLQLATASGLAVFAPLALRSRKAKADGSAYPGPFFITLNAGGAWDPTYLCDPKGGTMGDKTTINQLYTADSIGTSPAGFRYAPTVAKLTRTSTDSNGMPINGSDGKPQKEDVPVYSNKEFFETHESRLVVINGIDTSTNNHDVGTRVTWSGLPAENTPSFASMVAANAAATSAAPLAYLSSGGYDYTAGLVGITRTGNLDLMRGIAYPNAADAKNPNTTQYQADVSFGNIRQTQADRLTRLQGSLKLPIHQRGLAALTAARSGDGGLQTMFDPMNLADYTPITAQSLPDVNGNPIIPKDADNQNLVDGLIGTCAQAQIAMLAFRVGVAASANLNMGYGYDTHKNHDDSHPFNLVMLAKALDFIWWQAAQWGIADQIVVIAGSDFGRTPTYNTDNGKDHWNITSMLVMANPDLAGNLGITKLGQTVGSTDAGFVANGIDGQAGTPRFQPEHIHTELRTIAGLPASITDPYPLGVNPVPVITG